MTKMTPLTVQAPGGPLTSFYAKSDDFPNPAVIVIQEWWGIEGHIQDLVLRFAQLGYTALAPDLYRGQQPTEPDEARKLAMELDRDQVVADLQAVVGWLDQQRVPAIGVVGFCMGGGIVWSLAHEDDRLEAAVPFYGRADVEGKRLRCPVQAHYGAEDPSMPPEHIEAVRQHLATQPYAYEICVYEGAGHAFFNDTRPSYHPGAAELAWERMVGFFANELGPPM